jgi:hypothetical protein
MLRVALNAWGFVAFLVIAGGANICLSHTAFAEGNCPPGQTDKLKKYKGVCMPIEAGREDAGESSKCPPGQTDKLKKYKGVCMPIEAGREDAGEKSKWDVLRNRQN